MSLVDRIIEDGFTKCEPIITTDVHGNQTATMIKSNKGKYVPLADAEVVLERLMTLMLRNNKQET